MPQLGVAAVVIKNERVLLTKREDFANWCLPGGAVDDGETIEQAAIREAREETGLDIQLTHMVGIASKPNWGPGGTHTVVFAAIPITTTLVPQASEVTEIGFYDLHDLPSPLFWEHRQYIRDALEKTSGHVWVNMVQPPAIFANRRALYRWRDELGLSRLQAYEQLMQMCGVQQLEMRLGPKQGIVIQKEELPNTK